ncbi:MAG: methyltransferase domain-containing protein [Patescibacteria group bacterium]
MSKDYLQLNKETYDRLAKEFQDKIGSRLSSDKRVVERFVSFLPTPSSNINILDIGPGNGNMSMLLSELGYNVTAIEISPEMTRVASNNAPKAKIITDDFLSHQFDKSFTGILAIAFIHLFPKQDLFRVLNKIKDLLENDGKVYFSTTKHRNSEEGMFSKNNFKDKSKRFRHKFTKEELWEQLEKIGFRIIDYSEDIGCEEENKIWMNFIVSK